MCTDPGQGLKCRCVLVCQGLSVCCQSSEETEEDESSESSEETAPKKRRPVIPGERKSERERQSVSVTPTSSQSALHHTVTSQCLCLGINGPADSALLIFESADTF